MKCKKCGAELREEGLYCHECGQGKNDPLLCPSCGKELPDGSKFCNFCGKSLFESMENKMEPAIAEPSIDTKIVYQENKSNVSNVNAQQSIPTYGETCSWAKYNLRNNTSFIGDVNGGDFDPGLNEYGYHLCYDMQKRGSLLPSWDKKTYIIYSAHKPDYYFTKSDVSYVKMKSDKCYLEEKGNPKLGREYEIKFKDNKITILKIIESEASRFDASMLGVLQ